MSTIRIVRNDAGNCINFYGASNPTYWNACLSASIDEAYPDRINVRNDIRSAEEGTDIYEFYQIPYTSFLDKDSNTFDSPADAAQYITNNANVTGDTGTFIFSESDAIDVQREATDTTLLFSNGDIFPVNALRAVAADNGTITVRTIRGAKDIYVNVRHYNLTLNNGAIAFNTLAAAVDRLNEMLTGTTVGTDGGKVAANAPTSSSAATFDVYGARITETGSGSTLGYTSTADGDNFDTSNGILSVQSISEAGEFFEFSQDSGDWTNAVGLTFGLFDETTYDRSDLESDLAADSVKAVLRLRVKNSGFIYKDPASSYGRLNESGIRNQLSTRTTFRVGLDAERRGYIAFQDANGLYENVGRTESAIASGTVLKFVAIFPGANELNGVRNMTVNTLIAGAPILTWHYIESPDGSFHYPLFTTAEQANFVDEQYGTADEGLGSSHQELFIDEQPSQNIWFMPDTFAFEDEAAAPTSPAGVPWNVIETADDANYIPAAYVDNTVTVDEGVAINLEIKPSGDSATYSVTGIPSGLAFNGSHLTGTAPEVTDNNVNNPSDTFAITVTKANDYGSSVGTLTLVVNNLTQPATALSGFTWDNTSATLVDASTMGEGSVVTLDDTLQDGKRFVIDETWVEANVLPNLLADGDEVVIGVAASGANWTSVEDADFDFYMSWRRNASNQIISNLYDGSDNELTINSLTDAYYDYGFEVNGTDVYMIACNVGDLNSEPSPADGGSFIRVETIASYGGTIPLTLTMATISAECGLSTSGISEINTPVASIMTTSWTKALDFSGSSERIEQISNASGHSPIKMGGVNNNVAAPSVTGYTSSATDARAWAVACVFKPDGDVSNEHIWNLGEGPGTGNDNIYLRMDASGIIYFGWGRDGALNEVAFGSGFKSTTSIQKYWGVYIASNGTRLSPTDATAANLAAAFDIRIMHYSGSGWQFAGVNGNFADSVGNRSTQTNWNRTGSSTGARMNYSFGGNMTVGGRGSTESFHGKVASMVVTTLRSNVAMPTDAEITEMVTDPMGWLNTYKVGQSYRRSNEGADHTSNFALNDTDSAYSTQVWLMGDGTSDAFSQIRNQVYPAETTRTPMDMVSMVSNDIETVSITGLS